MTVRTYWFFPVFSEASGNLDLQPFARFDQIDACRPRAMYAHILRGSRGIPGRIVTLRLGFPARSDRDAQLELVEEVLREPGHLVEIVDRVVAAHALTVGQHPRRLGDREPLLA
jgi:hypothetical protein